MDSFPNLEKKLDDYATRFDDPKKVYTQDELLTVKTNQNKKIPNKKWAELMATDKDQLLADSEVAKIMWNILDENVEKALWRTNKALMREYWAVRELEKSLARRIGVFQRNSQGWLAWLTDIFNLPDMIIWGMTWDIKQLWRWLIGKWVAAFKQRAENPNVIIKELFKMHWPDRPWFVARKLWLEPKEFKGRPWERVWLIPKEEQTIKEVWELLAKPKKKGLDKVKATKSAEEVIDITDDKAIREALFSDKNLKWIKWLKAAEDSIFDDVMIWELKAISKKPSTVKINKVATDITKRLWVAKQHVKKTVEIVKKYIKKYWAELKNKFADLVDEIADKTWTRSKLLWWEQALKAPVTQLEKAKNMTKAWKSADDIWKTTWWEKGKDGKWRFEIDDTKAKVKKTAVEEIDTLEDVLDHKQLFENYPEVKDVKFRVEKLDWWTLAEFNSKTNTIFIDPKGFTENWDLVLNKKALSSILHEVQHNIQKIEWFGRWWSPELWEKLIKAEKIAAEKKSKAEALSSKKVVWLDKKIDNLTKKSSYEAYKTADEFAYSKDVPDWLKWEFSFKDANRADIIPKVEKKIWRKLTKTEITNIEKMMEDKWIYLPKLLKDVRDLRKEKSDFISKEIQRGLPKSETPFERYQELAWEVEARNIQKRLWLKVKDRPRPELTEDVPRGKQVIIWQREIEKSVDEAVLDLTKAWKKVNTIKQFKDEIKAWLHDELLDKIFKLRWKIDRVKLLDTPKTKAIDDLIDFFPKKVNSLSQLRKEIKAWLHDDLLKKIYNFKDVQLRKEVIKWLKRK